MMPYKDDILRELEAALAQAEPEKIRRVLSDIARGQFSEAAQTRAGGNEDRSNVTDMVHTKKPLADSDGPDMPRARYSS